MRAFFSLFAVPAAVSLVEQAETALTEQILQHAESPAEQLFGKDRVEAMHREVATQLGGEGDAVLTALLETITPDHLKPHPDKKPEDPLWLAPLTDMMLQTQRQADLALARAEKEEDELQSLVETSSKLLPGLLSADVPCTSDTFCNILELVANKCNYGRLGIEAVYEIVNLVAHVLSIVENILCLCLHVTTIDMCFAPMIPFVNTVCNYPYEVYSQIFAATGKIWEVQKKMTKMCIVHGDPLISS